MSEDQQQPETVQEQSARQHSAMAWAKLILDFLPKAFYPTIIVVVLLMLYPSLAQVDWPGLINRLQSASVGTTQLTFNQAEDVAITIAPLNTQVAKLERTIARLEDEIETLRASTGTPPLTTTVSPESAEKMRRIEANNAYTVLVFHSRESRERALNITSQLLGAGYTASTTETDFAELPRKRPPGSIYMTHTEAAEAVYGWIAEMIEKLYPTANLTVLDQPSSLRRGEVQVLVF